MLFHKAFTMEIYDHLFFVLDTILYTKILWSEIEVRELIKESPFIQSIQEDNRAYSISFHNFEAYKTESRGKSVNDVTYSRSCVMHSEINGFIFVV